MSTSMYTKERTDPSLGEEEGQWDILSPDGEVLATVTEEDSNRLLMHLNRVVLTPGSEFPTQSAPRVGDTDAF